MVVASSLPETELRYSVANGPQSPQQQTLAFYQQFMNAHGGTEFHFADYWTKLDCKRSYDHQVDVFRHDDKRQQPQMISVTDMEYCADDNVIDNVIRESRNSLMGAESDKPCPPIMVVMLQLRRRDKIAMTVVASRTISTLAGGIPVCGVRSRSHHTTPPPAKTRRNEFPPLRVEYRLSA